MQSGTIDNCWSINTNELRFTNPTAYIYMSDGRIIDLNILANNYMGYIPHGATENRLDQLETQIKELIEQNHNLLQRNQLLEERLNEIEVWKEI